MSEDDETRREANQRPLLSRILREPTLQFSVAAGLLFGVGWLFGSGAEPVIEIDRSAIELRVLQAELIQGTPLDAEARRRIEEAYVDERVLVHEALALGLEIDERIDDILAQKMLHVLSGEVIQPSDAELEAYYASNRARYAPEPTVDVDEAVIAPDVTDPMELPPALRTAAAPEDLVGSVLLRHRVMGSLSRETLTQLFDGTFADRVIGSEPGSWIGPYRSVSGQHWIRLNERTTPPPAPLEEIRDEVRLDWVTEQETERLAQRVAELRAQYSIRILGEGL